MARRKKAKRPSSRKRKQVAKKKLARQVKRAASDGKVTAKEVRKIKALKKKSGSKLSIKKTVKNTVASRNKKGRSTTVGKGAAKGLKINKKGRGKINNPKEEPKGRKPDPTDETTTEPTDKTKEPTDKKKGCGEGYRKNKKGKCVKIREPETEEPEEGDDYCSSGTTWSSEKGKCVKEEEVIEEDIKESGDGDSKYYRNFNYKKALTKASEAAKERDEKARAAYKKPKRISLKKNQLKDLEKDTGYDKIKSRIGDDGRLKDKKGALKAKPPSLKKYKQQIKQIKSPYAKKIAAIGGGYDEKARKKRSQSRLGDLAKKLKPTSKSPFGKNYKSTSKIKSGYGDAGSDLLKRFSDTKRSEQVKGIKRRKKRKEQKRENARVWKLSTSGLYSKPKML